jgi:hypothetical protein
MTWSSRKRFMHLWGQEGESSKKKVTPGGELQKISKAFRIKCGNCFFPPFFCFFLSRRHTTYENMYSFKIGLWGNDNIAKQYPLREGEMKGKKA